MKRQSQQGVALVITLILLSVITFMAVTFLVVSRKEAASVSTLTQQANAKYASEAGLEEAKAQLIAQMLINTNGLNFGLLVSTNFRSGTNFAPGNASLTNVTYDGVAAANIPQLMNNLLILPRAPVFIVTNKAFPNNQDFRFYLDLNRNGRYDTNGLVLNLDSNNVPLPSAANPSFSVQIGDPEWVGILNHPDQRHSSSNQFVARYCFIALPIGNSLDINFIHNQAEAQVAMTTPVADQGYLRNQGVGSWEINLAGFLNALNTNSWPTADYNYTGLTANTPLPQPDSGIAFSDAAAVMQYRYNRSYANIGRFADVFNTPGSVNAVGQFGNDFIDGFSTGPLQTNTAPLTVDRDFGLMNNAPRFWSGANNPNAFFTTQDFYGTIPPLNGGISTFTNHLRAPGLSRGTYDRYTYYRMLAQMSFGSAPESSASYNANTTLPFPGYFPFTTRLNLNYNNVSGANATNFQPWVPIVFFTNAANRLLANAGLTNIFVNAPLSVTNIPIYPVNMYTPAVHRLLQLAANIYDATTNRFTNTPEGTLYYPSVFRPTFSSNVFRGVNVIYINGYVEDVPTTPAGTFTGAFSSPPISLPEQTNSFVPTLSAGNTTSNLYGIPWVIGAKKGFPNFNEFSMASASQITRKLEVINLTPGSTTTLKFQTNIQYTIGVSNSLGIEAWNSYSNFYGRAIDLTGTVIVRSSLSNFDAVSGNMTPLSFADTTNAWQFTINPAAGNVWAGAIVSPSSPHNFNTNSFRVPLATNFIILRDSVYHQNPTPRLSPGTNFDVPASVFQPHFILNVSNYVRYIVQDHDTGRVLDYVTLNGMNFTRDLTAELPGTDNGGNGGVWLADAQLTGIKNQIRISSGTPSSVTFLSSGWINDSLQGNSQQSATTLFGNFLNGLGGLTNAMQAPYTPTRKVVVNYSWQANDPLVHYTLGDLTPIPNNIVTNYPTLITTLGTNYLLNIGQANPRYRPWGDFGTPGGSRLDPDAVDANNLAFKDPQISGSDSWQFPTNKFPNVGWLGRVHRGTPWQTVYLKSSSPDLGKWQNWIGNTNVNPFGTTTYPLTFPDALLSAPTNDWSILDLFTTAPNENASRGQLSVNQTNFAAWAAILDGVIAVSNGPSGQIPVIIDPKTNNDAILQIVNGINLARTNFVVFPGQVFTSIGQILAAPQLTVQSPYLNTNAPQTSATYPTDAEIERIPQQIMSLLRVGSPRYVIFAYGQSLKPADHSIVQSSGPFFGICTNYAITGEVATRTVLRIDSPPIPGRAPTSPRAVVESFNVLPPE